MLVELKVERVMNYEVGIDGERSSECDSFMGSIDGCRVAEVEEATRRGG